MYIGKKDETYEELKKVLSEKSKLLKEPLRVSKELPEDHSPVKYLKEVISNIEKQIASSEKYVDDATMRILREQVCLAYLRGSLAVAQRLLRENEE